MDLNRFIKYSGLLLLLVGIAFVCSCETASNNAKLNVLADYPPILESIEANNQKIPSFYSKFSMSSRSQGKNLNADGVAYIDKIGNRLKIVLIDTLTRDTVMDLVKIDDKIQIYLFNEKGGVIIEGKFGKLNLADYVEGFTMDLKDLLHLVSAESYIFKQFDEILEKEDQDYYYYQLTDQNKMEILSVSKSDKKIEKIAFFENDKRIFRLNYKKYSQEKNFYYPKRSDFFHSEDNREKSILYLSETNFNYNFNPELFKLNNYPSAKRIYDDTDSL